MICLVGLIWGENKCAVGCIGLVPTLGRVHWENQRDRKESKRLWDTEGGNKTQTNYAWNCVRASPEEVMQIL